MPGSIRRYAVDFDGDGRVDLTSSAADAIGSVASFLMAHGWQRDAPIVFEATADEAIVDALGRGINATVTWSDALAAGVEGDVPLPLDAQVLVIDLPIVNAGETERLYRVGTVNFSALLHYNRSYLCERRGRAFARDCAGSSYSASGCDEGCASINAGNCMQLSKMRMMVGIEFVAVHPLRVEYLRHDDDIGQCHHVAECVAAAARFRDQSRFERCKPVFNPVPVPRVLLFLADCQRPDQVSQHAQII